MKPLFLTTLILSGLAIPPALAQSCGANETEIITLKPPTFREPIIESFTYKKPLEQRALGAITLPDNNMLVISESQEKFTYKADVPKEEAPEEKLAEEETDEKAEEAAEETTTPKTVAQDVPDIEEIIPLVQIEAFDTKDILQWQKSFDDYLAPEGVQAVPHGDTLLFLSQILSDTGDLGFDISAFDMLSEANRNAQKQIFTPGARMYAYNIASDESSLYVSATVQAGEELAAGKIFKFSNTLQPLWQKSYAPGHDSTLYTVQPGKDALLAGGSILNNGHKSGWALLLDKDGNLKWQQIIRRGQANFFNHAAFYGNGALLLAGDVLPFDGEYRSVHLLLLNPIDGTVIWERFIKTDYDLKAKGLYVSDTGLTNLLLAAEGHMAYRKNDHARLVTFNTIGQLVNEESVLENNGVRPVSMIVNNRQERLISGDTFLTHPDSDEERSRADTGTDAWIAAMPKLLDVENPCFSRYTEAKRIDFHP